MGSDQTHNPGEYWFWNRGLYWQLLLSRQIVTITLTKT
jgi:hypothetical protein